MRVILKKSEGIAFLIVDDVVEITIRYTNDYVIGEVGNLCQIVHSIYKDDKYFHRHERKKHHS